MANIREIQTRINSVKDTMKITNAMYMISSTKMRQAKKKLTDSEPYFYGLQGEISSAPPHPLHPLQCPPQECSSSAEASSVAVSSCCPQQE